MTTLERAVASMGQTPLERTTKANDTSPRQDEQPHLDPTPLADALPPVEVFTPELIPDSLRAWVMDVAARTQAPVEYVAVSAMVSLGAALGERSRCARSGATIGANLQTCGARLSGRRVG